MNAQQETYAAAKAYCDTVTAIAEDGERQYCLKHRFITASGEPAQKLYQCDCDEDAFDRICKDFEHSPLNHYQEQQEAVRLLYQAEEELLDFSLSIIPDHLQSLLEKARQNPKIRQKMIDYAFRLDTSTIPKGVRV